MTKSSLIEFPCYFPIKIIGTHSQAFIDEVKALTLSHFPNFNEQDLTEQVSKNANYLAITVKVYAENQKNLDDFYSEISKLAGIKMVL